MAPFFLVVPLPSVVSPSSGHLCGLPFLPLSDCQPLKDRSGTQEPGIVCAHVCSVA